MGAADGGDLLFAAALRKAVELGVSLSPARVMLREGGFLEIGMQDTGPEPEEYRAPEMAESYPRRVDARAQVYAAGAVGYELFTGLPPPRPPNGPGPELTWGCSEMWSGWRWPTTGASASATCSSCSTRSR